MDDYCDGAQFTNHTDPRLFYQNKSPEHINKTEEKKEKVRKALNDYENYVAMIEGNQE